jgi:hypothetical protein
MGRPPGGMTMCGRILNEDDFVAIDDLVETDQFVPSGFVLAVAISQKMTPSASAFEERERQYDLQAQQSLTAAVFGDPLPGRSALDRWRAEQARVARQSENEED